MHTIVIHKGITAKGKTTYSITVGTALPVNISKEDAEQIIEANNIPERNTVTAPNGTVIHVFTTSEMTGDERLTDEG